MKKISFLLSILCITLSCQNKQKDDTFQLNYTKGEAFGTGYTIQFVAKEKLDLKASYDSIVDVINNSMSTYINTSDISKINKGDTTVVVDTHFKKVFEASKRIHKQTKGAFDPTIGVLVNAWDFGPEGKIVALDSTRITELLNTVGLDKVILAENKIFKEDPKTFLDFNALAKGYAVDVMANFLENKGYEHFLVEIGGEIRVKGKNEVKDKPWKIGVEDPNFDGSQSYSKVISLTDNAMATSGSYRKFKQDEEGNRYAHIINTKTGYPHKSNLLSVSVITATCMEADAYATALMTMGLKDAKDFLLLHPELKVYLIYEDDNQELQTESFNGFPEN
ncbi:FAD:protein FMN transferase [Aquimarina brevivitae]|uniref:FAD:protein FMN transferase n=1 Tax=Aquimarina brevivitae TaxID=323412 RepID=A0A4Q7NXJ6_9FLAO|nr:FAD:protein FMN transferase [Aquimarina brevivitae]RZS91964.1 thiamine biosynthesis lipoprotein [Aquimarina brevivitae]